MCLERGKTIPAEVVHHLDPPKGDRNKFFTNKLQSLCKLCHDFYCQQVEKGGGFHREIGTDGYPTDSRHPLYADPPWKRGR
jgi:hypothetical protein